MADQDHGKTVECEKEVLPDGTVLIIEKWEDGSVSYIEQSPDVAKVQQQLEENDLGG